VILVLRKQLEGLIMCMAVVSQKKTQSLFGSKVFVLEISTCRTCGRPETQVNNEELKAIVEADPFQTTSELAAGCGDSNKTVSIHLEQIEKIKKLESCVPQELSEGNRQMRVDCCFTLLNRYNNKGFLNLSITCDEK
jgi:hypothetical protein